MISFVCSVGNIPLAAVLWNGGISFGDAIAFIFADLIILPILNIYRKYYGMKMAAFLFATFYAAMAGAALIVELIFGVLGLVPAQRNARVVDASITWNYTTRRTDIAECLKRAMNRHSQSLCFQSRGLILSKSARC